LTSETEPEPEPECDPGLMDEVNSMRKRSGWVGRYVVPFEVFSKVGLVYSVGGVSGRRNRAAGMSQWMLMLMRW
jgi:hypothetical protein